MSLLRTSIPRQWARIALRRQFHSSPARLIAVGDAIPSAQLKEDSPGNSVDIAKELEGLKKAIIVGVPAAFSTPGMFGKACAQLHPSQGNWEHADIRGRRERSLRDESTSTMDSYAELL
ncbi:hypothetical protein ABW21_db0209462 [Orbilia brochopaga]|nr:hypothetical protein ABW21_db0209462 [Drechslerella brochopaga]